MEYSQHTIDKLQKLKKDFFTALPDRLANLKTQWRVFLNKSDHEALHQVILTVHTLSGTSGTFGYEKLSEMTKDLEGKLLSIASLDSEQAESYAAITGKIDELGEFALTMPEATQFLEKPANDKAKGN